MKMSAERIAELSLTAKYFAESPLNQIFLLKFQQTVIEVRAGQWAISVVEWAIFVYIDG